MTAINEATDSAPGTEITDGTPVDEKTQPRTARADVVPEGVAEDTEDVAEAAARDVARLLDRRGLREVVALAHRVLRESTRLATTGPPRADESEANRCTLRQHERSTRRGAAGRAVDDDRA
jgi:hypothetical protein